RVTEAVGGKGHTCILGADGNAFCWGTNTHGQVGDSSTTPRLTPVPLVGLLPAARISAGSEHTCAILANGSPRCWGRNDLGQLGDGSNLDRTAPAVVAGLTAVATPVALDVGAQHACVRMSDGSIRCWGQNDHGQLGDGTRAPHFEPRTVEGISELIG